ncbi:MAG: hypothetical protein BMS9Abin05_1039 [Rhodothermia bacterium]|nr:MAG: hypothetical protein BMS9Abin05_1039 [Rhodothermia bacterium]
MQKKLTITIDENVYDGLYRVIGAGKISQFIEQMLRPHVVGEDLDLAYAEMGRDEDREKEALEWIEAFIEDIDDETR